jgi:hypothetical protein
MTDENDQPASLYDPTQGSTNKRICYFYDNDYAGMYYGADHPMKPPRIAMTHSLVVGYGLDEKMDVYQPRRAQVCASMSHFLIAVKRRPTVRG